MLCHKFQGNTTMKKTGIPIFLFLLLISRLYPQDTAWKKKVIDENLTIAFPGHVTQIDTSFVKEGKEMRFKAYKCETEIVNLALIITPKETGSRVDNSESLQKTLAQMAKGASDKMSEQGINCLVSDTIVDNIACKKLTCRTNLYSTIINYLFLVNDKMYSLQGIFFDNDNSKSGASELNNFLNSVHFNKASIKENQFNSKAESIGYKAGQLIFYLMLFVGIIALIVYTIKRKG